MHLSLCTQDNTLRLSLTEPVSGPSTTRVVPAVIDVADSGRLIGVEIMAEAAPHLAEDLSPWAADMVASKYVELSRDAAYIQLSDAGESNLDLTREAEVSLTFEYDDEARLAVISIPRRGHGYEISYPSGNR